MGPTDDDDEDVARPSIDPRIRQRRVAIQRSQGRRRLRWVLAAVVVLALIAALIALLHTPPFSVRVVKVSGPHAHTSDSAIIAAADLTGHPPMISVSLGGTADKVEALPYIASAKVSRNWPDGITISVTERAPVVQMAGPSTSWSVLDGRGRTLQVGPARLPDLVVLIVHTATGGVPPAPVGKSLPPTADAGLEVARTLPKAFSAQVVSLTVAPDNTVSMALNSGITVLLGTDTDLPAKYEDVATILAHETLHPTSTIDVTVPQSPTTSG
jgi:cell division protein FtsQ